MKEATGELSMTVITIVAIVAIATILTKFVVPEVTSYIKDNWTKIESDGIENSVQNDLNR